MSFIGKFRDECFSLEWYRSRPEAKAIRESWDGTETGRVPELSGNGLVSSTNKCGSS